MEQLTALSLDVSGRVGTRAHDEIAQIILSIAPSLHPVRRMTSESISKIFILVQNNLNPVDGNSAKDALTFQSHFLAVVSPLGAVEN